MSTLPSSGATGSSAPVLEFVCLFTHDLRRKQKRWQDGRLKFHTFNKRVMVYDDRGNFIGDMHWQRDYEFDEGEEIELERGGVIVQVSECVGRQNQDLSELLDKRAREREQRQSRVVARPVAPGAQGSLRTPIPPARVRLEHADHPQPTNRPLHQYISTPTGHHGRAHVPVESPFERRHQADETPENRNDSRAAKRRKYDETPASKLGYAQALFGAQLTLSAVPMSSAPLRRPASSVNRTQTEHSTSQEQNHGQEEAPGEVQEISASLAVRAGLPRANMIAPLLKARPDSRQSVPDRSRNAMESRSENRDKSDRPTELSARKQPRKHDPRADNGQSAPTRPAAAPAKPNPKLPSRTSSAVVGSKRPGMMVGHKEITARTLPGNSHSESIILDDDTSGDEDQESSADAKLQEITNSLVSKLSVPAAERKKSAKGKKSLLSPAPPKLRQPVPERVLPRSDDSDKEKQTLPESEEPRVELRMKPRQKRGLLMLSDKGSKPKRPKARHEPDESRDLAPNPPQRNQDVITATSPAAPVKNLLCVSISEHDDDFRLPPLDMESGKSTPLDNAAAGRSRATESISDLPVSSNDKSIPRSPPRQNTKVTQYAASATTRMPLVRNPANVIQQRKQASPIRENSETERSDTSEDELPNRKLGKRKSLPVEESESEGEDLPQVPVGPRLARLGRKNVKSREVIGFIPSSSPVPSPNFNMGLFSHLPVVEKDATSGAREPHAALEDEESARAEEKEFSRPDFGSSVQTRQPSCPPIEVAERPPEVDASTSPMSERPPNNKKLSTKAPVSATLVNEGCGGQIHVSESKNQEQAAPTEQTIGDNPGDTNLAYAGTAGNMQNSAGREKDSAPQTTGPVADSRATPDAVTTSTLQSGSHKNEMVPDPHKNPTNLSNGVGVLPAVTNEPKTSTAQTPFAGSSNRPRIANPATRGRKAALKSDAAGQVPQSILPPHDAAFVRPNISAPQAARAGATVNERPKRVMRFPGFTTARVGGGPWSREADDLLETGRPS